MATLRMVGYRADLRLLEAVYPLYLGFLLVVALALLLSTQTSSTLAAVGTVGVVLAGRYSDVIRNMRQVAPGAPQEVVSVLYYLLPNFANLDFKDRVAYGDAVGLGTLLLVTAYAGVYLGPPADRGPHILQPARPPVRALLLALWMAGLAFGVVALQKRLDGRLGTFRATEETLYMWSGQHVKRLVPGFRNLAADLYWLRTVQYFGGQRLFAEDKRFELLAPLTEITTTLDPRLEIAYRYGAIFLCEPRPLGAGRPREGVALLEKGVENVPHSWRLRQDLGFFTHLFLRDSKRAAEILDEASNLPGAAFWLKTLAAQVLEKSGDRASSRRMWQQMYDQAEGDFIKTNARERLRVLEALDQADRLTAAVREFERRLDRRPHDLGELRARGLAPVAIVDSAGVPFQYDPLSGQVTVSAKSPLWRPK